MQFALGELLRYAGGRLSVAASSFATPSRDIRPQQFRGERHDQEEESSPLDSSRLLYLSFLNGSHGGGDESPVRRNDPFSELPPHVLLFCWFPHKSDAERD